MVARTTKIKHAGFTLIELLVVISIIAVLAGILFPTFSKARERAVASRSLSNIRQLAMAIQQYAGDNDDRLPGWASGDSGTIVHNVWDEQIDPFIRNKDVFSNGDKGIASPSQPRPWSRTLTYVMNGALLSPWASGNVDFAQYKPTALSTLHNPSGTIVLAEVATNAGYEPSAAPALVPSHFSGSGSAAREYSRAIGGSVAIGGTIDADPKLWVEQGRGAAAYSETVVYGYGIPANSMGIGRDLYGAGACYAFVDGHVEFQKLAFTTVGASGLSPETNWDPASTNITLNQWYPD